MSTIRTVFVLAALALAGLNPLAAFAQATPEAAPSVVVTEEFGPVPTGAAGPAIPEVGYLVEEIDSGLYWVTEGLYQAIFLTTGEGVIVVDAPPTIGPNLAAAIASVTDEPVTHLVYSHHHADHIGAAAQFENVEIVAHEDTAALLDRSADPNRPLPTVTFADTYELTVGSQTLELAYPGNNHEPGNIFIYAPAQKTLMLVDVVFPGWAPFPDLGVVEDVPGYVAAHDAALAYDFETFVGGHLTRLGTREDVEIAQEYVLDVRENAGEALATVDFMAIAQEVGFENPWLLFDVYLDTVAQTCADTTIPVWADRLGGTDVVAFGHCWVMAESLRID